MSLYNEGPTYGIRDRQQDKPVELCGECDGELYSGDPVFCVNGKLLCKGCFLEWLKEQLENRPVMLADWVGAEARYI